MNSRKLKFSNKTSMPLSDFKMLSVDNNLSQSFPIFRHSSDVVGQNFSIMESKKIFSSINDSNNVRK